MSISSQCGICGHDLIEGITTFDTVTDNAVYVVKGVPCLKCDYCDEEIFEQDVTDKLYLLASGRALPIRKPMKAWVYHWNDKVMLVTGDSKTEKTENIPLGSAKTESIPISSFPQPVSG